MCRDTEDEKIGNTHKHVHKCGGRSNSTSGASNDYDDNRRWERRKRG